MRAGLGVRVYLHGTGPEFLSARSGEINRSGPVHAGRLRCVGIEMVTANNLDAFGQPVLCIGHIVLPFVPSHR
jgi:hypothetical protein